MYVHSCQGSDEAESEKIFKGVKGHSPPKKMNSRLIVVCFGDSFSQFFKQNFIRLA